MTKPSIETILTAEHLSNLATESNRSAYENTKDPNSTIIGRQLAEISKLTKNPLLAKKIKELSDFAEKL